MTADDLPISICLNTHNGRRFLPETLAAVRAQTHAAWELVVVEDASVEPVRDLVEAFAATVPQRVRYQALAVQAGCAGSRERAFALAAHPHLAPLDHDDIWKPDHLAALARTFAAEDAELVFSGCTTFTESIDRTGPDFVPTPAQVGRLAEAFFYCQLWTQPSSMGLHRRLFDRIGPWSRGLELKPPGLPGSRDMGEDRNVLLRAIRAGVEPRWTGAITNYYRQHPASMRGRDPWHLVHRAWLHNELGLFPQFPRAPQRAYLAHVNANAARVLAAGPAHRRLAASFQFRAWRWQPARLDRLARAAALRLASLS